MIDVIQGSEAWAKCRLGKVTASRVADVIARTKSGYSTSRANYAAQLIVERLTGIPTESFTNAAMQWGTETEPEARIAYAFYANVDVEQIGFVDHPMIAMTGASPDGLVGDDGLIEIKAPHTATHLDMLTTQKVPGKYITQMMWQMACTNRSWCDFVSYDPRLPEHLRLFVKRIQRDDALIQDLETEVIIFLKEVDDKLAALDALDERAAA